MIRGMDFPNDIETNVYKIENVNEIQWALYVRKENGEEKNRTKASEVEEPDIASIVQHVAYRLRDHGHPVLLDEDMRSIWVFCLSEADELDANHILDHTPLQRFQSGRAKSTDVAFTSIQKQGTVFPKPPTTAKPSPVSHGGTSEPAIQTSRLNMAPTMPPHAPGSSVIRGDRWHDTGSSDAHQKVTSALSQSAIHAVSKDKRYLQVGRSSCLDTDTLSDRSFGFSESNLAGGASSIISCTVQWISSGSLLFFWSQKPVSKVCTLSQTFSKSTDAPLIEPGDSILLAPSGMIGQFHGVFKSPKVHSSQYAEEDIRKRIFARLIQSGFSMPDDIQWIYVLLGTDGNPTDSVNTIIKGKNAQMILWPAHLCLSIASKCPAPTMEAQEFLKLLDGPRDPLQRVQTWLLGKSTRAKALERRHQKDEVEADKAKATEDVDEGDLVDYWQRGINQDQTPRDISGIYPTPPDGLPSIANEPVAGSNPQSHAAATADEVLAVGRTDVKGQSHPDQGADGMFGEMDIDMFATKGLTEDDFNFFDEPNADIDQLFENEDSPSPEPMDTEYVDVPMDDHDGVAIEPSQERAASPVLSSHRRSPGGTPRESKEEVQSGKNEVGTAAAPNVQNGDSEMPIREGLATKSSTLVVTSLVPNLGSHEEPSFNTVSLPTVSSEFDDKYTAQGRYGFSHGTDKADRLEISDQPPSPSTALPRVGMGCAEGADDNSDISSDSDDIDCVTSKSSDISMNDYSYRVAEDTHQQESRKRKRNRSEVLDHPATPLSSAPSNEVLDQPEIETGTTHNALFLLEEHEEKNTFFGVRSGKKTFCSSLFDFGDSTFVHIAQIVADQAISSMNIFQDTTENLTQEVHAQTTELHQHIQESLTDWFSRSGKSCKRSTFKEFVDLDDQDSLKHKAQKPSYPNRTSSVTGQPVNKIQSPFACVQRSGTQIDIAPSALRFWEELSLGPAHDSKDVRAFCVYPKEHEIQAEVSTFLSMVKGAYQSCKLGQHEIGYDAAKLGSGLCSVPMGGGNLQGDLTETNRACETFGLRLGNAKLRGANTVIYMINPNGRKEYLPLLCAAFIKLFDAYTTAIRENGTTEPNDIVLQIVSSEFVYSSAGLVFPSPTDYKKMAFEVYDRCAPMESNMQTGRLQYMCAPSIRLARGVPKSIDFRLTPQYNTLSLQTDSCLHIAYAWAPGEDWLTAYWTDNLGVLSWCACFCFGGSNDDEASWQSFSEIAHEIWATTLEMLQPRNGPWRLLLCKDGPVLRRELDVWQSVASNVAKPIKFGVLFDFLTIEDHPMLEFPTQPNNIKYFDLASASLETPDSTPQATTPSQDIPGLGSTSGGPAQTSTPPPNSAFSDAEADAKLVDITDETWSVATDRDLGSRFGPPDFCPPLASGYLLKRAGPRDEHGMLRIGVNVIHGQKPCRSVLKVVLAMYRNLGLLARVRGITDPITGMKPYHIAAARKAHDVVNATMTYGDG